VKAVAGSLNLLAVLPETSCCAQPGAFIFFERSKKTNQKKTAPLTCRLRRFPAQSTNNPGPSEWPSLAMLPPLRASSARPLRALIGFFAPCSGCVKRGMGCKLVGPCKLLGFPVIRESRRFGCDLAPLEPTSTVAGIRNRPRRGRGRDAEPDCGTGTCRPIRPNLRCRAQ
jgi:hypothetical protein